MEDVKAKVFFIDGTIETKTKMTPTELTDMLDDLGFEILGQISPFPSEDIQKALKGLEEDAKNSPTTTIEDLDAYLDSVSDTEDESHGARVEDIIKEINEEIKNTKDTEFNYVEYALEKEMWDKIEKFYSEKDYYVIKGVIETEDNQYIEGIIVCW